MNNWPVHPVQNAWPPLPSLGWPPVDLSMATQITRQASGAMLLPGVLNFSDSAGTTPAVQDGVVGYVRDASGGSFYASQSTTGYKPILRKGALNLLLNSNTLATQNVTVYAVPYTLQIQGTGSVALLGAYTGTLNAPGTLTFTPTAGTLTLTPTGTVNNAMLEIGTTASQYVATTSAPASNGIGNWWWEGGGVQTVMNTNFMQGTSSGLAIGFEALALNYYSPLGSITTSGGNNGGSEIKLRNDGSAWALTLNGTTANIPSYPNAYQAGIPAVHSINFSPTTAQYDVNSVQVINNAQITTVATLPVSILASASPAGEYLLGACYGAAMWNTQLNASQLLIINRYLGSLTGILI